EADMAAEIESGPVINGGVRRSIIRSLRIGGLSRNRRCGQHRSNAADCQKSVHAMPPDLQTACARTSSKRSGRHNADCAFYRRPAVESEAVLPMCNFWR